MGKDAVWQCCDEWDVHLVIALRICWNVAYIKIYTASNRSSDVCCFFPAKTNFPLLSRDWDVRYSFSFSQGFWFRIQSRRTIRSCVISVIVLRNSIDCFDIKLFGAVRKRSFAILLWLKPFKLFSSVQPFNFVCAMKIYIRAAVRLHPCEKNYIRVAVRLHPCNTNLHPCSRSQYPCRTAHRPVSHPFACRAFRREHGFRKEHFRVRGHTLLLRKKPYKSANNS